MSRHHVKTLDVLFDPTGDDRMGCLRIEDELFSWSDENLVVRIRNSLKKRHVTHIHKVGDVEDGEVVTTSQFLRELEVYSHGFR